MATIDLGKIKQVWRGTYNNSTAYTVDDLVAYTDTISGNPKLSTYICVTDSTGNTPASGGTVHGSWNLVADGAVSTIPAQSGNAGKFLKTNGSNLLFESTFVSGMILLWSGATNAIPTGWVICDGQNSTPDLRDRFVVGAGNSYSVGATGGSNTATDGVTISGSDTVSISGSDTVSISVSGNAQGFFAKPQSGTGIHTHQGTSHNNNNQLLQMYNASYARSYLTIPFSGSGSDTVNISGTDTVTISGTDTVSIDTRSPYYALCYIMKT